MARQFERREGDRGRKADERRHRMLAREEVVGAGRGFGDRRASLRVLRMAGELADGPPAIPQIQIARELCDEPRRGLRELQPLHDRVPRIEHDHRRRAGERVEHDRLFARVELRAPLDIALRRSHENRHRRMKHRCHWGPRGVGTCAVGLRLVHTQRE